MSLDPQVQEILKQVEKAAYPDYWQLTPAQARAQFEQTAPVLDAKPVALPKIEDLNICGPRGDIALRCYTPRLSDAPLPVLLWYHGGGFVLGGLNSYDALCRKLAQLSDCIVVAVDYRLAPEHKFPAAVEDCFAALDWAAEHADGLGGDLRRIAVAGDSAGGNLAAVCALLAREADHPKLAFQLLVYPCTASRPDSGSHHRFADGYLLTRKSILWFYQHYLGDENDSRDFRYAPLLTEDLSDLPPALVIVADHDPLYDEGVAYAKRLRAAGNSVELADYPGMVHAFYSMSGAVDAARDALERSARALRRAFQNV